MSCCGITQGVPGTPTFSSSYTAQRAAAARRADQSALLARLQGRVGSSSPCCPSPPNNRSALYASVLEQDNATRCQPSPAVQALTFPRQGTTESIRIQKKIDATLSCSVDPLDPNRRFSYYTTFVPNPPCPPLPTALLNSTTPKPTYFPGCLAQRNIL